MNYDTMSVEELRNQYDILWLEEMVLKKLGTVEQLESLRVDKELVFAALRSTIIREASVGRIEGTLVEVRNPVLPEYSHLDPRITIRWNENRLSFDVEKSDLLLIPISKETP